MVQADVQTADWLLADSVYDVASYTAGWMLYSISSYRLCSVAKSPQGSRNEGTCGPQCLVQLVQSSVFPAITFSAARFADPGN